MSAIECPLCSDATSIKFDWRDYLVYFMHITRILRYLVELMDVKEVTPTLEPIRTMYQASTTGIRIQTLFKIMRRKVVQ